MALCLFVLLLLCGWPAPGAAAVPALVPRGAPVTTGSDGGDLLLLPVQTARGRPLMDHRGDHSAGFQTGAANGKWPFSCVRFLAVVPGRRPPGKSLSAARLAAEIGQVLATSNDAARTTLPHLRPGIVVCDFRGGGKSLGDAGSWCSAWVRTRLPSWSSPPAAAGPWPTPKSECWHGFLGLG